MGSLVLHDIDLSQFVCFFAAVLKSEARPVGGNKVKWVSQANESCTTCRGGGGGGGL